MTLIPNTEDPIITETLALSDSLRLACHSLLDLLESTTKSSTSQEIDVETRTQRARHVKRLEAMLTQLKALHRAAFVATRESKERTARMRSEVDRLNLGLQNLWYESRHLRGEIVGCKDFPHKYTSLPLISEEEFLQENPEMASLTPHELMIARLKDEKLKREALEQERKKLLAKKQALVSENKRSKEDLEKSAKSVESILNQVTALAPMMVKKV